MPKKPLPSFINIPEQKKDFSLEPESSSGKPRVNLEALEALAKAQAEMQEQRQAEPVEEKREEKQEEKQEKPKKEAKDLPYVDEADLRTFYNARARILTEMASPEQERMAEKKAGKLDIRTMHKFGELRQQVPIGDSGITVTFRSIRGSEGLEILRLLEEQTDRSYAYHDALANIYLVTAALWDINGETLPSHLKDNRFDREAFRKKVQAVSSLPDPLIGAISVHYGWFEARARKLFMFRNEEDETEAEKQIKNG